MTVRAGRQAEVHATERRRFLAALGGLGGALAIAAAFVFVPSSTPPPPPAPRIDVELPQPAALATPPMRAAVIASLESDTAADRPLAPGPRPLAPEDRQLTRHQDGRPSGRQSHAADNARLSERFPLQAVAMLRVDTPVPTIAPTTVTPVAVAVNRDATPTTLARASAVLTPSDEAPPLRVDGARKDDDRRDPFTGAFVTAASHIGGGFRTMGRAIKKVF